MSKKRITLVTPSLGVPCREIEGCTYRWKGFVLGHSLVEIVKEIIRHCYHGVNILLPRAAHPN